MTWTLLWRHMAFGGSRVRVAFSAVKVSGPTGLLTLEHAHSLIRTQFRITSYRVNTYDSLSSQAMHVSLMVPCRENDWVSLQSPYIISASTFIIILYIQGHFWMFGDPKPLSMCGVHILFCMLKWETMNTLLTWIRKMLDKHTKTILNCMQSKHKPYNS